MFFHKIPNPKPITMCSPKVALTANQLKRRKYFAKIILNDVSQLIKKGNKIGYHQPPEMKRLKNTEFNFIYIVIFRGVQTYFCDLEVDKLQFKKLGTNCKELALYLDRELVKNCYTQANNLLKTKK